MHQSLNMLMTPSDRLATAVVGPVHHPATNLTCRIFRYASQQGKVSVNEFMPQRMPWHRLGGAGLGTWPTVLFRIANAF